MTNVIYAPSSITTAKPYSSKEINIRSFAPNFRTRTSHKGVFSSGSTSPDVKPVYLKTDNYVSTNSAQTMIYSSDILTVFVAGLGDVLMNVEVRKSLSVINEIASLQDNWNDNGAPAFSQKLIGRCKKIVRALKYQPDIFPTAQESVQMEWNSSAGGYLEIELFENGICQVAVRMCDGNWTECVIDDATIGEYVDKFFA